MAYHAAPMTATDSRDERPNDTDPEPPRALSSCFGEALVLASELHARQLRKGTRIPYVSHLLGAASIALEYGADEETAIAALLHDAIEDQGGEATERLIHDRFGARVATIVRACSDTDEVPKPPWRARKEAYLVHLASADGATLLVSASDKLHNARTILADLRAEGPSVWDRFSGGRDGTLWYYRALVTAFRAHPDHRPGLIDELDRTVSAIEDPASLG